MLTIRLQRVGRKNDPSFRMVVTESKNKPQTGKYLEMVGSYDARTDRVELKEERIKHWISMGATTSETVHNLLVGKKLVEGKKINVLPRKSPIQKEGAEAAPAAAAEPAAEAPAEETPAEETPAEPVSNDVAPETSAQ